MMKRVISCLLAFVLLFSLCGSAIAVGANASANVTASGRGTVTVQVKVPGGKGSSHGRVTTALPEGVSVASAKSLLGKGAIADLKTTNTSVSFAWACYQDLQGETAVLELTLRGKPGTFTLRFDLPETGGSFELAVRFTQAFDDVQNPDSWYYDAVYEAYGLGLMNGKSASIFAPKASMTRAMLVTTLYRMAGSPEVSGKAPYSDVRAGSYYEKAVIWADQTGVVKGTGSGKFAPGDLVTRQQAATMLYRYAVKIAKISTGSRADLSTFRDGGSVSAYAMSAMRWAVGAGMLQGFPDGTLRPNGNLTRAQAASMLVWLAAQK